VDAAWRNFLALNRELVSARSVSDWATEPRRQCSMAHGGVEGGASQQAGGVGHFGGQPSRVTVGDTGMT
jgi:hypothetical protein